MMVGNQCLHSRLLPANTDLATDLDGEGGGGGGWSNALRLPTAVTHKLWFNIFLLGADLKLGRKYTLPRTTHCRNRSGQGGGGGKRHYYGAERAKSVSCPATATHTHTQTNFDLKFSERGQVKRRRGGGGGLSATHVLARDF